MQQSQEKSAGFRATVLVVEDDLATQTFLHLVLSRRFTVILAASADEARRKLAEFPGEIDTILMDLSLGGDEDGLSLTRQLRAQERWRSVPIIATTAHAFPEDRLRALQAGCSEVLTKPYSHHELLAMVETLLQRSAPRGA